MPVQMGLWRIDDGQPRRVVPSPLPLEKELEDLLVEDPALLGTRLLIFGRQVLTRQGKFIDLLGMDVDGVVHVLELKRDKTPREVVAQVLDYGQWVSTLDREAILAIGRSHLGRELAEAFSETFDGEPLPDEINDEQRLVVVASSLDDSSERIVEYLHGFGVPINAVFFAHMEDDGRHYVARSWLMDDEVKPPPSAGQRGKRSEWNGVDWYVSFGEEGGSRSWDDARRLGFVSAGGGRFYTHTVRNLPLDARVNVVIPGKGYVGVGRVTGAPVRVIDSDSYKNRQLAGSYRHDGEEQDDDVAEWMVPVEWLHVLPREQAFWKQGMFANQNSACRLRDEFTLEQLAERFPVEEG